MEVDAVSPGDFGRNNVSWVDVPSPTAELSQEPVPSVVTPATATPGSTSRHDHSRCPHGPVRIENLPAQPKPDPGTEDQSATKMRPVMVWPGDGIVLFLHMTESGP